MNRDIKKNQMDGINKPVQWAAAHGYYLIVCPITLVFALLLFGKVSGPGSEREGYYGSAMMVTPWKGVGGCGAGGGGSKAGSAIEWTGQGISGALLDLQIMPSSSITSKDPGGGITEVRSLSLPIIAYLHSTSGSTLGLTVPFSSIACSMEPGTYNVVGLGDMDVSLSRRFGAGNQFNLLGSIGIPTGRHDIYNDDNTRDPGLLPTAGQLGLGIFMGNLSVDATIDKDWGFYLIGGGYSAGLFYRKTTETGYDEELSRAVATKKKFAWARKKAFISQNDLWMEQPDNIRAKFTLGIRKAKIFHSFHILGASPLRFTTSAFDPQYTNLNADVIGIPDSLLTWQSVEHWLDTARISDGASELKYSNADLIDILTDPSGTVNYWIRQRLESKSKVWPTLTLGYGMEIHDSDMPLFWAIGVPVEFDFDKRPGIKGFSMQVGIKLAAW